MEYRINSIVRCDYGIGKIIGGGFSYYYGYPKKYLIMIGDKVFKTDKVFDLISEPKQEYCSVCGKPIRDGEQNLLETEFICDDCETNKLRNKEIVWCSVCRRYHYIKQLEENYLKYGGYDCDIYVSLNYIKCKCCGKIIRKDFGKYIDGNYYCSDCYIEKTKYFIKSYHDNPQRIFYKKGKKPQKRNYKFAGYGVELEVDRGGEDHEISENVIKLLNEEVYTMHDGSLNNGFEIITHPHEEEPLLNMNWKETFDYLIKKKYKSHDSGTCGLHLHISKNLFNSDDSIKKMMYFYNNNRDDIVIFSRRRETELNSWARFITPNYNETLRTSVDRVFREENIYRSHNRRYACVNLQNRSTIEIRCMRGTLNYNTFIVTLQFMIEIAKMSNNISWEDVDNNEKWLKNMPQNVKDYMGERHCFGYNTNQGEEDYE